MPAPFVVPNSVAARLSALLLALAAVVHAAPVEAQVATTPTSYPSFPPTNVSVEIDGEMQTNAGALYINKDQCNNANGGKGSKIEVTLKTLSSIPNLTLLENWVGQSTTSGGFTTSSSGGQNCWQGTNRTANINSTTTSHRTTCYGPIAANPPIANINQTMQVVTVYAKDLFSSDKANKKVCDLVAAQSLYIVPLTNATPTSGPAMDGLANPMNTLYEIKFFVKTTPLGAPTSAKGGSGDTQVKLSWTAPSGANQQTSYDVYYDLSGKSEAGSDCTSELLKAGKALPKSSDLQKDSIGRGTSTTVNPQSDLKLDINEQLPAVVVSVDVANNTSVASSVFCVERVQTLGFYAACQADPKCKNSFDTCSLSHTSKGELSGWSLSLLGLALWLRRRRTV